MGGPLKRVTYHRGRRTASRILLQRPKKGKATGRRVRLLPGEGGTTTWWKGAEGTSEETDEGEGRGEGRASGRIYCLLL